MKKVVSFSGGRTSAYLCYIMKERYGDDVDFIFMDTGAEHPKTYEFIRKVNDEFGLNLVCLRGNFNQPLGTAHSYNIVSIDEICHDLGPFGDMCKKYGTPSHAGRWCTSRMKQEVHDKYCDDTYGDGGYQTWLGIRADEPRRLSKMGLQDKIKYLADVSGAGKEDVMDFWSKMPFDLEIPEWLGNCVFCFKKSHLKLAAAASDETELLAEWLNMIERAKERPEQDRGSRFVMYRNKMDIRQVIGLFDGSTGNEIKARIRGAKMTDAGSCSESCEVFSCSL